MLTRQFSDEFDALIKIKGYTYELDEYEKSILLTEAQESLVVGLYNGTVKGVSFEETEELRKYLSELICEDTFSLDSSTDDSYIFTTKDSILFTIYEKVNLEKGVYCEGKTEMSVVPMRYDEWNRVKNNPFRGPNDRRAIRLDLGDNKVEIVSRHPVVSYYLRYLKKPNPIILVDLPDGLEIDDFNTNTECELNTALHRYILRTAVQLALEKYAKQSS